MTLVADEANAQIEQKEGDRRRLLEKRQQFRNVSKIEMQQNELELSKMEKPITLHSANDFGLWLLKYFDEFSETKYPQLYKRMSEEFVKEYKYVLYWYNRHLQTFAAIPQQINKYWLILSGEWRIIFMKIEAMSNSLNKIVIENLVRYSINSGTIVLILYRQEDFKRVM